MWAVELDGGAGRGDGSISWSRLEPGTASTLELRPNSCPSVTPESSILEDFGGGLFDDGDLDGERSCMVRLFSAGIGWNVEKTEARTELLQVDLGFVYIQWRVF